MENHSIQKEIFLVTSSRFTQNELCCVRLSHTESVNNTSEELDEACSDALIDSILPPVNSGDKIPGRLFIWQLFVGDQFVCADMSEKPFTSDALDSINPFLFFKHLTRN
jgi:hypothetical protein